MRKSIKTSELISGWPLVRKLFALYGTVALMSGGAAIFVFACLSRPVEMVCMVAGAVLGLMYRRYMGRVHTMLHSISCWFEAGHRHA